MGWILVDIAVAMAGVGGVINCIFQTLFMRAAEMRQERL